MADNGRLDEEKRRRPDGFKAGVVVELADGQGWALPIPKCFMVVHPQYGYGWDCPEYGPDYGKMLTTMEHTRSERELYATQMNLGAFLLRKNYDLNDDEIATLLRVPSSPEIINHDIFLAIRSAGRGFGDYVAPKPIGDGSTSR